MSNKRQVFVSLHHRDSPSLGGNRQRLGYAAYHWGILISPKNSKGLDCYAFDVSDGLILDPVNRLNCNEGYNWHFREKVNVDPTQGGHLIGMVMVGKVPHEAIDAQIYGLLKAIPLPQKGSRPEQNCVTWTKAVIYTLRENGFVEIFDIDRFMDKTLAFADQRIHRTKSTPNRINYTSRSM